MPAFLVVDVTPRFLARPPFFAGVSKAAYLHCRDVARQAVSPIRPLGSSPHDWVPMTGPGLQFSQKIEQEVVWAKQLYAKHPEWLVLDVTLK